jgi:5'-3' exonuclease
VRADRPEKCLLLDTASLYFRAFFGIPGTVFSEDGKTPVNAVRGLLDFISRLVGTYEPTHLVAAWDEDWRPQWRVDLIPSYKSHRVARPVKGGVDVEETPSDLDAQVPIIADVLDTLGIARVGAPMFEADDIIGTLAKTSTRPVDIVTGDRDLFQLVSDADGVRVINTSRGMSNLEVVTDGFVARKYGIVPEQYADFAVMRGDTSDGLPGVPGVGEKTAASLLGQYGDLAGVVAAAADPKSKLASGVRSKLLAANDYLAVAPTVVEVVCDIDLPDFDAEIRPLSEDQLAEVARLGKRWGLGSSLTRVLAALEEAAGS